MSDNVEFFAAAIDGGVQVISGLQLMCLGKLFTEQYFIIPSGFKQAALAQDDLVQQATAVVRE